MNTTFSTCCIAVCIVRVRINSIKMWNHPWWWYNHSATNPNQSWPPSQALYKQFIWLLFLHVIFEDLYIFYVKLLTATISSLATDCRLRNRWYIYSLAGKKAGSENIKQISSTRITSSLVESKSRHNSCVEGLETIKMCQSKELCHLHEIWSQGWEGGHKKTFGKNMFLLNLLTSLKELKWIHQQITKEN